MRNKIQTCTAWMDNIKILFIRLPAEGTILFAEDRGKWRKNGHCVKTTHGTQPSYPSQVVCVAGLSGRHLPQSAWTKPLLIPHGQIAFDEVTGFRVCRHSRCRNQTARVRSEIGIRTRAGGKSGRCCRANYSYSQGRADAKWAGRDGSRACRGNSLLRGAARHSSVRRVSRTRS